MCHFFHRKSNVDFDFSEKNKVNKYKTTAADIDEIIITGAIVIC